MRRCIVSRAVRPRSTLLRFVVDPDGGIVPDVDERLPGRGLWLSPNRDMIEMAARKRAFARAARQQVSVPEDLGDRVASLLTRRCLDLLALARRAGQVVWGFDSVRTRLKEGAGRGLERGLERGLGRRHCCLRPATARPTLERRSRRWPQPWPRRTDDPKRPPPWLPASRRTNWGSRWAATTPFMWRWIKAGWRTLCWRVVAAWRGSGPAP